MNPESKDTEEGLLSCFCTYRFRVDVSDYEHTVRVYSQGCQCLGYRYRYHVPGTGTF